MTQTATRNRYLGCLLGLACGDAVGTTVEFKPRGTFPPVTDMTGGGPFGLRAGQWTDDTSMALCLADSLLACGGFSPQDQIEHYVRWYQDGYRSSTGRCFDIGTTTRNALERFMAEGAPFAGSTDPYSAGNGSIMRLAPVPMFFAPDLPAVVHTSADSSRTTHAAAEAVDACKLFGLMIARALAGATKEEILQAGIEYPLDALSPAVAALAQGDYRHKTLDQIRGSGYVIQSLEAALWVFDRTASFKEAVLAAVNLGDDTDTTGAVVGQLAGACYGLDGIPSGWLDKLHQREEITALAESLFAQGLGSSHED